MPLLPTDSVMRKDTPICTGMLDYFPRAAAYVARISVLGNDKHNPGEPLHWAKGKSMDQPDCIVRHVIERGTFDPDDGALHDGKLAWRSLANLETELERREAAGLPAWDEEIIAQNKAAMHEKLAAKAVATAIPPMSALEELEKRSGLPLADCVAKDRLEFTDADRCVPRLKEQPPFKGGTVTVVDGCKSPVSRWGDADTFGGPRPRQPQAKGNVGATFGGEHPYDKTEEHDMGSARRVRAGIDDRDYPSVLDEIDHKRSSGN